MRSPRAPAGLLLALVLSAVAAGADCAKTTTGMIPLNDLGDGTYQGFPGGLYPGGVNMRPAAHDAAGLLRAAQVVPRDAAGQPAPGGRIVFLSIGMSNATQEFSVFQQLAQADPARNAAVEVVDGAQGGQAAEDMVDPNAPYWGFVLQRLQQQGVTPAQVQVVWLQNANRNPTAPFPQHAQNLRVQLGQILHNVQGHFPNTRIGYLGSRTYAGYAAGPLNPEPYAYEQGFALKWLIQDQILGLPTLNHDPAKGPVWAPWLAFAAYTWADGLSPRSDLLTWECQDFQNDGTHPSPSGRLKVATMLLDFVHTDATARSWYLAAPTPSCIPRARNLTYGTGAGGPNGVPEITGSDLLTVPTPQPVFVHVYGAPAHAPGIFVFGLAPLPDGQTPFLGSSLLAKPQLVVPAATGAFGKAWLPLGSVPASGALCGLPAFFQYAVLDPDSPSGYDVTRGLRMDAGH